MDFIAYTIEIQRVYMEVSGDNVTVYAVSCEACE